MDTDPEPESIDVTPAQSTEALPTKISNDKDKSATVDGESNFTSKTPTASITMEVITKAPLLEYRDVNIDDEKESCSESNSIVLESSSDNNLDHEIPFDENVSKQTKETMNEIRTDMQNMGLHDHEKNYDILYALSLKSIRGRRPSEDANIMPIIDEDSSEKENEPPNKRQKFE